MVLLKNAKTRMEMQDVQTARAQPESNYANQFTTAKMDLYAVEMALAKDDFNNDLLLTTISANIAMHIDVQMEHELISTDKSLTKLALTSNYKEKSFADKEKKFDCKAHLGVECYKLKIEKIHSQGSTNIMVEFLELINDLTEDDQMIDNYNYLLKNYL